MALTTLGLIATWTPDSGPSAGIPLAIGCLQDFKTPSASIEFIDITCMEDLERKYQRGLVDTAGEGSLTFLGCDVATFVLGDEGVIDIDCFSAHVMISSVEISGSIGDKITTTIGIRLTPAPITTTSTTTPAP